MWLISFNLKLERSASLLISAGREFQTPMVAGTKEFAYDLTRECIVWKVELMPLLFTAMQSFKSICLWWCLWKMLILIVNVLFQVIANWDGWSFLLDYFPVASRHKQIELPAAEPFQVDAASGCSHRPRDPKQLMRIRVVVECRFCSIVLWFRDNNFLDFFVRMPAFDWLSCISHQHEVAKRAFCWWLLLSI